MASFRSVPPNFADHQSHLEILRAAALRAVDPARAVHRHLSPADFPSAGHIFVVGAGKAGVAMAQAAAKILGDRLTSGVVSVPRLPSPSEGELQATIHFILGGHPTPTRGSLAAGRALADLLAQADARDLVVALISGGGSALLELPSVGLTLDDLQITNHLLLQSGATITEVNTVRTHLSQIKGGGLLRLAHPARVLALILSDVVGNPLPIIASGPTVPASSTPPDALAVIDQYNLRSLLPPLVLHHLTSPSAKSATTSVAASVENRIIASNRLAGEAAATAARELGFDAHFHADDWQGEAREVGERFAKMLTSPPPPAVPSGDALAGRGVRCVIVGGESTVTVRGQGTGGRNQEAALAAALVIEGRPNLVISTFATDGVDGPTLAAGATVTGETLARARALGLDPQAYLDNNDSYSFFSALSDLVLTGPTGTNVNDLLFGLAYSG